MNALVWGIQWRLALADRRGLWLRVLLPLALIVVAFTGAVPVGPGCGGCVALFVGLAMIQTALPMLRDEDSGLAARVIRGGISPSSYLLQRAAAAAALVLVSLLPSLAVIAVARGASPTETLVATGALTLSLWIGATLGALIGGVSRSIPETVMIATAVLVLLLHVSGVFSAPAPDTVGAWLEAASPFRMLRESFTEMSSGRSVEGTLSAVAWAVALPTGVGLLARRILGGVRAGRLAGPTRD